MRGGALQRTTEERIVITLVHDHCGRSSSVEILPKSGLAQQIYCQHCGYCTFLDSWHEPFA